jgi:hypothetical protein
MLTVPSDVPSALGASRTSDIESSGAGVPRGTATGRGELKGTRARPATLTTDDATKGRYGGITRCVVV